MIHQACHFPEKTLVLASWEEVGREGEARGGTGGTGL
jgi:hypothetical protein